MADLGAIGRHIPSANSAAAGGGPLRFIRAGDWLQPISEIDTAFGNPLPALHQRRAGVIGGIPWRVAAGARSLSVDSYFLHGAVDTRRPRIWIRAHSGVGIAADLITTVANTPATWITTTINFTAGRAGILEVCLELQSVDHQAEVWWDNITTS